MIIKVSSDDKIWRIEPDDNLTDALFGGVLTAAGDFFGPDPLPPPVESDGSGGVGDGE